MKAVTASAVCKAAPDIACKRILSEEGLLAWWIGKLKIVGIDPLWPALHTKMSWRAGGGLFNAHIKEDNRPAQVVMEVVTPGANSLITHSFKSLPDGGTLYSKTVEPRGRGTIGRLLSPLLVLMLNSFVKKEVQRAAAFADAARTAQ